MIESQKWQRILYRHSYALRCRYHQRRPHPRMSHFLKATTPSRNCRFEDLNCLAVDLELTSLAAEGEILSIGLVPITKGEIQLSGQRHWILKTRQSVGQSATIHYIHDHQQQQGLPLQLGLRLLLRALHGKVLVVHHAPVDHRFLNQACQACFGLPLAIPIIDTLALEQRRLERRNISYQGGDLQLIQCRQRYHLPAHHAHSALTDAIATAELLQAQVSHMGGQQRVTLGELR